MRLGYNWKTLLEGMVDSISSAMSAILILLLIGSLAGTWLLSGIIPAMIYYGLKILNPTIFLVAACLVCIIVSLATGSSWSTAATIGIALIGIGKALGVGEGVIAGAVISGAYFGDKMSPLSDTTNLAPAMAGTDLFTHIRYMVYTTVPSITITIIIFLVMGFTYDFKASSADVQMVMGAIENTFNTSPLLFLVPAAVIFMIVRKIPAIPALLTGMLLGCVFAVIFQPDIVRQVAGTEGSLWKAFYIGVMKAMFGSISVTADNPMVDDLLSAGGMAGMLETIWLVVCAMVFGGVLEKAGLLQRITEELIRFAQSVTSLVATTAGTCLFFNITASDQYISIVVPGRMFAKTFRDRGLAPELLSRTVEDSGTVTSVLIPWNTCGAYQSGVLGVPTFTYLPYCFFNILSPLMTVFIAAIGFRIRRLVAGQQPSETAEAQEQAGV